MREYVESRHSRIWRTAVGLLAVLGVAAALVFIGWSTNLVVFGLAAFVAGSASFSLGMAGERPVREVVQDVPRWAGIGGLVALAITGYGVAVGLDTFALLGVIVASSPQVVAWLRPAEVRQPAKAGVRRATKPLVKVPPAPPIDLPAVPSYQSAVRQTLSELTDEELCLAWRRSFTQLRWATGPERRQVMADVRRAYLDELERRHPDEFAAWIGSARAAGDPTKFFNHHPN
jgi:hypothetical protein